jgi:MSHA biogenesis protein MshO
VSTLGRTTSNGFTLVELVTVIIVLGIVSVGISGFIRTSLDIFSDVTEREQLLGDSRFVVERINRELRMAVPHSVRVGNNASNSVQCIEFLPSEWVSFYTSLSVQPDTSTSATVVEWGNNPSGFVWQAGDFAIVYPTDNNEVYDLSENKRIAITACIDNGADSECSSADDPEGTAQLTLAAAFEDHSPASRLYIARKAISYCADTNGNIYRNEINIDNINNIQAFYTSGNLMAENLKNDFNQVDEAPFRVYEATLQRNSLVHILFAFERNGEIINYNSGVHVPNVP